jgi:O-antigen/teichoic acid export membrane protein
VEIVHVFWDARFTQKVIEFGRPMTIWLVLSFTLSVADRFILKIYHGYTTAGAYSAISDLLQGIVTLFCMPVLLSYHPKILELWNSNHRKEAMATMRDALIFDFLIGLILFIAVMILRDDFYSGFLGLEDKGIYAVSVVLVINAFIWQVILLFQKPLEMFARRKFKNAAVLAALVFNITGNLIFVPHFGYYATAVVMFCSYVIYLVLIFVLYRNLARETADQHVSK